MTDFEKFYLSKHHYGRSTLDSVVNHQNQFISPYILEERQLHVTQMDVFSRLMMDRILFFGTEFCRETCNIVNAQLLFLESTDAGKDISIYVNSPGGSVYDGLGVIDTMNFISSPVATICTGMAASMGAMLLVSGEKGKRASLKHGRIMIHQPLGGTSGQASDIEIEAREILKIKSELYDILSEKTGQPKEKIYQDADRNYWMIAQEALDYGMIDKVIDRK
jgi:ATP-dependent Clp protease protease subunit